MCCSTATRKKILGKVQATVNDYNTLYVKTEDGVVSHQEGDTFYIGATLDTLHAADVDHTHRVALDNDVVGSATIGPNNDVIKVTRRGCMVGNMSPGGANPWFKFASMRPWTGPGDVETSLIVHVTVKSDQDSESDGILHARVRVGSGGEWKAGSFRWEYAGQGIRADDFVLVRSTDTPCSVELWVKLAKITRRAIFDVVGESRGIFRGVYWDLADSNAALGGGGQANFPSGDNLTNMPSVPEKLQNPTEGMADQQNVHDVKDPEKGVPSGDLDDLKGPDYWGMQFFGKEGNGCTHKPPGTDSFGLFVLQCGEHETTQFLYDTKTHSFWVRTWDGERWSEWIEVGAHAKEAEKLDTARRLSVSGDATGEAMFDGSGDANIQLSLTPTGVGAGVYGTTTQSTAHSGTFEVPRITINDKGQITVAERSTVTLPPEKQIVFYQGTQPPNDKNSIWIDQNTSNVAKVYNGSAWVVVHTCWAE